MKKYKKIGITIEARTSATRLPGKTLKSLLGKPMLARMIERLKMVRSADIIVLATTDQPQDLPLVELAQEMGIGFHQGSSEDVLDRVLKAAQKYEIDLIMWGVIWSRPILMAWMLNYLRQKLCKK